MATFEYRQAEEVRDAFARQGVRYLFLGKSAAILLGFPDTTQDADLFPEKSAANGQAIVRALRDLGFTLTAAQESEIVRCKDFVQLKTGPFDIDLIFAPDGIERFADAWQRRRCRRLSLLPSRRHHPQQRSRRAGQGLGIVAASDCLPRVLAAKKTAILTPGRP